MAGAVTPPIAEGVHISVAVLLHIWYIRTAYSLSGTSFCSVLVGFDSGSLVRIEGRQLSAQPFRSDG